MKLGFLALILQILGENSRKLESLSVSLSKIKFWSFSLSSSLQNGCCAPFYILQFRASSCQDNVSSLQRDQFSLQRVLLVCTPDPLDLDTFAAANLVLAAATSYFVAANLTLAVVNTFCLASLYASILRLFGIDSHVSLVFVSYKKNTINEHQNDSKTF